jgi:hypothetical protein
VNKRAGWNFRTSSSGVVAGPNSPSTRLMDEDRGGLLADVAIWGRIELDQAKSRWRG